MKLKGPLLVPILLLFLLVAGGFVLARLVSSVDSEKPTGVTTGGASQAITELLVSSCQTGPAAASEEICRCEVDRLAANGYDSDSDWRRLLSAARATSSATGSAERADLAAARAACGHSTGQPQPAPGG
jgi:hypothetical protein